MAGPKLQPILQEANQSSRSARQRRRALFAVLLMCALRLSCLVAMELYSVFETPGPAGAPLSEIAVVLQWWHLLTVLLDSLLTN